MVDFNQFDDNFILKCSITIGNCNYYEEFAITTDCDPCDIDNSKNKFTKSYAGPNGGLLTALNSEAIYQMREIHFAHVKTLSNN